MSQTLINYLIAQFYEIDIGQPWLDEWFAKKLDPIDEEKAFTVPQENVHCVAEILSHLVVWRREIISRLKGNPRKLEVDSPENWKSIDDLRKPGWETLLKDYRSTQDELIQFLAEKDDNFLHQKYVPSGMTHCYYVEGLIHHDLYHLGQIGLVLKMLSLKS